MREDAQRDVTSRAVSALARFVGSAETNGLDPSRLARGGCALLESGCSRGAPLLRTVLARRLRSFQSPDGGWADVEETAWCLGFLAAFESQYAAAVEKGRSWLRSQRVPGGGWGRTERDRPRIPVTGLVSQLVPAVVDADSLCWLAHEWEEDLAGQTPLTYKGGFFLLAQTHPEAPLAHALVDQTIAFLAAEQNDDGGFAPWRRHPLGSDPWSTGVILWGLSAFAPRVPKYLLSAAVAWLERTQLPDGNWPYHYLDEGTSLALIGLAAIQSVL